MDIFCSLIYERDERVERKYENGDSAASERVVWQLSIGDIAVQARGSELPASHWLPSHRVDVHSLYGRRGLHAFYYRLSTTRRLGAGFKSIDEQPALSPPHLLFAACLVVEPRAPRIFSHLLDTTHGSSRYDGSVIALLRKSYSLDPIK